MFKVLVVGLTLYAVTNGATAISAIICATEISANGAIGKIVIEHQKLYPRYVRGPHTNFRKNWGICF